MAKILIVEDEKSVATYLSELLLSAGHVPLSADSVIHAREVLEAETGFSLIILDHHLGHESGLDLLAELRKSERHRHLPVIVCSGDARQTSVKSFLPLRIVGFIVKPFVADRFLAEIERVLQRREEPAHAPSSDSIGQSRPFDQKFAAT